MNFLKLKTRIARIVRIHEIGSDEDVYLYGRVVGFIGKPVTRKIEIEFVVVFFLPTG